MKTNSRQPAANTVKGSPKIGGLSMRVVENDGRGVELLREPGAALESQPFALRASRNPRERNIGDEMVVVVKPSDIAVAAWK